MNVANAKKVWWSVAKNHAPIFLARVVDATAASVTQAAISTATYTISRLDPNDPDSRTAVTSHSAISLTVSAIIYNALQLDDLWKDDDGNYLDDSGYNLKVQPSMATAVPFAVAGAEYLMEVTLTPTSGEKILVRWFCKCS